MIEKPIDVIVLVFWTICWVGIGFYLGKIWEMLRKQNKRRRKK